MLHGAEAVPGDAETIARLHLDVRRATYRGLIPQPALDADSLEARTAMWRERLADPERSVLIVRRGARPAGFACARPMPARPNGREPLPGFDGYLESIYVDPALHGAGAGGTLIRGVAARLLARGISSLALHMVLGNPARGFYEHLGARYVREEQASAFGFAWSVAAYGWRDIAALASEDRASW